VRAHTYTHSTLTRRGCTYIALLCNDDNFCSPSLSHSHTYPHHASLSSTLSPPPRMAVSWLRRGSPIGPFHRHSLYSGVTALAFLSDPNQTRERKNGRRETKQAQTKLSGDGGEFVRRPEVGDGWQWRRQLARTWRWLLTCARVRSFTSMSSSTDLGVAPAGGREEIDIR